MNKSMLKVGGVSAIAVAVSLALSACGGGGERFSKVAHDGSILSADAEEWSCVRDSETGLLWMVHNEEEGSLYYKGNTLTWYDPDAEGYAGVEDGGQCSGSRCDTAGFVEAVNEDGLCGKQNWRLPHRDDHFTLNGAIFGESLSSMSGEYRDALELFGPTEWGWSSAMSGGAGNFMRIRLRHRVSSQARHATDEWTGARLVADN
ncbi:DUF1566 domain-containing protein [Thioalkalivibrio sp. ALE14]|uniref:Lcl domain-containing protein n=1 Tax=Thioalkalivibrio sp. ALE14 TaxID=1158168 RepID=UPI000379B51C|nr:DUF1566 domain-containing protein [Thioalkalivibrio sp. ALE14]